MVGNTFGLGVRNKGTVTANTALAMTSFGSLINEGSINTNGLMAKMASLGDMKNTGTINSTAYITQVSSVGTLANEGTIASSKQIAISATGDLVNAGTMKGTQLLSVASGGNLTTRKGSNTVSDGQLTVSANNIDNAGSMRGNITYVEFSGDKLKVTGELRGHSTLTVQSKKDDKVNTGEIYNSGSIVGNNVTLVTDGILNQEGTLIGQNSLTLNTKVIDNTNYIYGNSLNVESDYVRNRATIDGYSNTISAANGIINEGQISASGDLTLRTLNHANITNYNTIKANGSLTMTTGTVKNGGYRCGFLNLATCGKGSISANKLVLNSYHNYASEMGGQQQYKYAEINTIR